MKKLLVLFLWLAPAVLLGQGAISQAEYFFDTDPGFGSATQVAVTPGTNVTISFTADVTGLTDGFHVLYGRVRSDSGSSLFYDTTGSIVNVQSGGWSLYYSKPFLKESGVSLANVSGAEYYIDSDPGFGAANAITISSPSTDITQSFTVDLSSVNNGFHVLHVRTKDLNGIWSIAYTKPFLKDQTTANTNVVNAEYYLDTDPGFGQAAPISISTPSSDISQSFTVDLSSASNGLHVLYVRTMDANGSWSIAYSKPFLREAGIAGAQVTNAEYYFDTDPGIGNGTSISITSPGTAIIQGFTADLSGLPNGFHVFYVRVKDADGLWSIAYAKPFLKDPTGAVSNITGAEYFIDTDPGIGSGTSINISTPSSDITENFTADLNGVSDGFHVMYIRAMDDNGQWNIAYSKPFLKETYSQSDAPADISSIQYYYTKKGQNFGSYSFSSFTPSSDVTLHVPGNLSALSTDSTYELHMVAEDANGQKSLEYVHSFQVKSSVPDSVPNVANTISDQTLAEDFGSQYVANLDNIFFDYDAFFWDSLRYSISVSTASVNASITNDTLSLTSISNAFGTATVTVTATDDSGKTASTAFTVNVNQVLDPITLQAALPDTALSEDFGKIFYSILSGVFTNVDPDPLTYSVHALSAGVTPLLSSDSLYLRDSLNTASTVTIAVSATNGAYSAADTFVVTVSPVNDPPLLASALRDTSLNEDFGTTLIAKLSGSFSDVDNVSLTYTATAGTGVLVNVSNDSVFGQSSADFFGSVDIHVTASDGNLSVTDTLALIVNAVNDAPVLVTALKDTLFAQNFGRKFIRKVSNNFSDVDDVSLTYSATALTSGVTTSVSSDSLYLNSVTNFFGNVDVVVSASDNSLSAADTFRVTVQLIPLNLSVSVLQNPVLSKYADVIIVGDTALQAAPAVKVIVGSDSSNVSMTSVNTWVYKGSVEFTQSGAYTLRSSATSVLGASASFSRQYNVSLAKPDLSASVASIDGKAILSILPKTLSKETYLMSWQEEGVYHFGPPVALQRTAELTISYDPIMYPDARKLFIYSENDGNWIALRSQVYPASNTIKAKINSLGNFKLVLDKDYQGTNVVPASFALKQNYPNPFNPATTITYDLAEDAKMTLVIYNILGQKVRTMFQGNQLAGTYSMTWDGRNDQGRQVASSIYLYRIDAGRFVQTKKMTLIK